MNSQAAGMTGRILSNAWPAAVRTKQEVRASPILGFSITESAGAESNQMSLTRMTAYPEGVLDKISKSRVMAHIRSVWAKEERITSTSLSRQRPLLTARITTASALNMQPRDIAFMKMFGVNAHILAKNARTSQ